METENIKELFQELLVNNVNTIIKICIDYSNVLYFYRNEYITYNYNTEDSLCIDYISLDRAIQIFEDAGNSNKYLKITSSIIYDEFHIYGKNIERLLQSIKDHCFAYNIKIKIKILYH